MTAREMIDAYVLNHMITYNGERIISMIMDGDTVTINTESGPYVVKCDPEKS